MQQAPVAPPSGGSPVHQLLGGLLIVLEELAAVLAGELRNVIFREELQRLLQYGLRRRHCVHLRFRGAPAGEREREGGDKYDVVQNVMCVCEDSFSSSDFTSC